MPEIVNRDQAAAWDGDEGAHWAADAERYDATTAAYDEPLFAAAAIGRADVVLDVGCGNGFTTCAAAELAPRGRALGADLSSPMLEVARRIAAARGIANARFQQADAQVERFGDGAFDRVISRFGAMFFADLGAALANLARALRPGGRLAIAAWTDLDGNDWLRGIRECFAAGRDLPAPPVGAPGPFGLGDPDRNRALLEAAGFTDVGHVEHRLGFRMGAGVDDALAFMTATLPVRALLGPLDADARAESGARFRDLVERHAGPGGVEVGSAAWIVTATRT